MEYRRLGSSGLKVSEVCLGTWLSYGEGEEERAAEALTAKAFEVGINFFDTANVYAGGRSEEALGRTLKPYPRESYVVATKVHGRMGPGPNDRGLSRKHVMEQCERSLKRLGLNYIDLYQCHSMDQETPLEETLRALDDLVTAGKVLYLGFSNWTAAKIAEAAGIQRVVGLDRFVSCQPRYSLLRREVEQEVMPLCAREGIGLMVYSPLGQGILTGKYAPGQPPPEGSRAADPRSATFRMAEREEELLERVGALGPLAEREGLNRAQLALAWCLRRPEVSSVIIGASRPEQIAENAASSGKRLSAETLTEIDELFGGR